MVSSGQNAPISVIIITHDEENEMERCLSSVCWADEIVVVDSFSEDRTVEIARRFTDRVFEREFTDFSDQREFAASKCGNDWILSIDADEVISGELQSEIVAAVSDERFDAYYVPFATYIFGGWLKHGSWNPDYHLRLYRRSKGSWQRAVHERVITSGACGFLENPILHYAYSDISSWMASINKYSSLEAGLTDVPPKRLIAELFLRPSAIFIKNFILQGGYLDGPRGLVMCTIRASAEFLRWSKLWEKSCRRQDDGAPPPRRLTLRTMITRSLMKRGPG